MNRLETTNTEDMVYTRPLFSSTLLALFAVLRKNYHERHLADSEKSERAQKTAKSSQI